MYPQAVGLILFTDGCPYHDNKHTSVRLDLLALFFELDLDTMVVMRILPTQSWASLVEKVMSVLNLGLQGIALARCEMKNDEHEKVFKECNGMSSTRKSAEAFIVAIDANEKRATGDIEVTGLPATRAEQVSLLATEEEATSDADAENYHCPPT